MHPPPPPLVCSSARLAPFQRLVLIIMVCSTCRTRTNKARQMKIIYCDCASQCLFIAKLHTQLPFHFRRRPGSGCDRSTRPSRIRISALKSRQSMLTSALVQRSRLAGLPACRTGGATACTPISGPSVICLGRSATTNRRVGRCRMGRRGCGSTSLVGSAGACTRAASARGQQQSARSPAAIRVPPRSGPWRSSRRRHGPK